MREMSDKEWLAMSDREWLERRRQSCKAEGWAENEQRYVNLLAMMDAAERASPTPPTTEGEDSEVDVSGDVAAFCDASAVSCDRHLFIERARSFRVLASAIRSRALLSSPRVEDVRREALEEAALLADRINYGLACEIRSLSPPDGDGKQEQARPSGSPPISTLSKDTTK